jgi:Zn-finger nucleic acid-binding protein
VWLDRGELEKLIARATRDFDELDPRRGDFAPRRDDTPPRSVAYRDDDTPPRPVRYRDDDDDDHYRKDPRKKRRWYESLGDLFD